MDSVPIVGKILSEGNGMVAVLLLMVAGMAWFIKYLLGEAKEERGLTRTALENNTIILTKLEATINAAIHK